MSTTLLDLASRVFLLLATFRRKAARGAPLAGDQLRAEATRLFGELDQTAQREPAVAEAWKSARTVLVYLVDEVMTGTEWEHRAWWDDNVLESSVLNNPQKMRGILFFDELEKAKRMYREASGPKSAQNIRVSVHTLALLIHLFREKNLVRQKLANRSREVRGSNRSNWTGDIVCRDRNEIRLCQVGDFLGF